MIASSNVSDLKSSTLLSLKKMTTNNNGESVVDLLSKNYDIEYISGRLKIRVLFPIKEEHLCRLDLVCQEVYGEPGYASLLAKWNGISNPFSMSVGDILVCPTPDILTSSFIQEPDIDKRDVEATRSIWLDPKRATKQDLNRIEQLKKIALKEKNGSTDPKPTNLLREGEQAFIKDGNFISLAPYTNPNN